MTLVILTQLILKEHSYPWNILLRVVLYSFKPFSSCISTASPLIYSPISIGNLFKFRFERQARLGDWCGHNVLILSGDTWTDIYQHSLSKPYSTAQSRLSESGKTLSVLARTQNLWRIISRGFPVFLFVLTPESGRASSNHSSLDLRRLRTSISHLLDSKPRVTEKLIITCSSSAFVRRYLPKITHRKPIQPSFRLIAYMGCWPMCTSDDWVAPRSVWHVKVLRACRS